MNPLESVYWTAKGVGWDNVPRRLLQAYRVRSGWLRKRLNGVHFAAEQCSLTSITDSQRQQQWEQRRQRFFPIPTTDSLRQVVDEATAEQHLLQPCRELLAGQYPMFSHWKAPLGWPPDFNTDTTHQIDWPVGESWLATAKSGPPRNDIKLVWEPSRLSAAYLLARAYRYTGDHQWAEAFWQLIEAWIDQNPVNRSVAWGCGQEVAFRLMAALFGTFAVLDSPATTPEHLQKIDLLAWQSAKRIALNINYAISQENNHALSEAVGLFTAGVLFDQLPEAHRWAEAGQRILEQEIARQIYDDGSYVQHSMSYHRVMLDDMIWTVALGRLNGVTFTEPTLDRVRCSVRWLDQFVDSDSGRTPNLGANDGANVLPLSCSDYLDYRPVLDTAATVFDVAIGSYTGKSFQEKRRWICGDETQTPSANADDRSVHWAAPVGGYHILRKPAGYLLVKGANYRDRPGQCDTLHVDLWWNGVNVLRDSGSFQYYHDDSALKSHFYSVAAHNTVQVAGQEQMVKGPRFLWYCWPQVSCLQSDPEAIDIEARFSTVTPYRHRRRAQVTASGWSVHDTVTVLDRAHTPRFVTRWHLCPEADWQIEQADGCTVVSSATIGFQLRFSAQTEFQVSLADGQESLYYGTRRAVPVAVVDVFGNELSTVLEPR